MTENHDDTPEQNPEEMSFAELFESYNENLGRELAPGDMVDQK